MRVMAMSGKGCSCFAAIVMGVTGATLAAGPSRSARPTADVVPLAAKAGAAKGEEKKRDAKGEPTLPGGAWDTRALKAQFGLLKVEHNSTKGTVTWLLERKDDGYVSFNVNFYDADDVKLGQNWLEFVPDVSQVKKGERTRGTVTLLKDDVMKKVAKVVVTKR